LVALSCDFFDKPDGSIEVTTLLFPNNRYGITLDAAGEAVKQSFIWVHGCTCVLIAMKRALN
jgi:hypothetical protein